MARPKRFELLAPRFAVLCSIQLSYGRKLCETQGVSKSLTPLLMARSERFELPTYGFAVRCSIQLSYERMLCQLAL